MKKDFHGISSSCMDLDVVETSPPIDWSSKLNSRSKRKEVSHHEVINIEPDDDPNGIILIDDECDSSYKSKKSANTSVKNNTRKATDNIQPSKNTDAKMANGIIGYGFSEHDFSYDDDYMNLFQEGSIFNDDNAFLRSKFDTSTQIEAPIGWLKDPAEKKKLGSVSGLNHPFSQVQLGASGIGSSRQTQVAAKKPCGSGFSSSPAFPKSPPKNNKLNSPPFSHNLSSKMATGASSLLSGVPWKPLGFLNVPGASGLFLDNNSLGSMGQLPSQMNSNVKNKLTGTSIAKNKLTASSIVPSGPTSSIKNHGNLDDIMKKFQQFKQFDTIEDYSDHYYSKNGSSVNQQPKGWGKRIQEEWKILEKDLPDTIFVRVYESRMDILRAVIVGAQGTPYHDGLFFFDVFFPSGYPSVPPQVYYHSGGLRINPNLYDSGSVCLSLLNTWGGSGNEKWMPNVSTMLQVLVSIQVLILNENPFFNEPAFALYDKSEVGQKMAKDYSENTFILSLKTMVYTMRKPPKQFEEFVTGHFCQHAQDISGACKVYIERGAEVGSVTKGEVKNLQEKSKCSPHFQGYLKNYITMLVQAFVEIGAQDCDKFLSLAQMAGANSQLQSPYMPPGYQFFMPK